MIVFDVETGSIRLAAAGENAFIIRKGKKIKIPSAEIEAKLIEEFQKSHDSSKLDRFKKEFPKLAEGDTLLCGKKTFIQIDTSYNTGKEKPVDDWKSRAGKSVYMGPNSELQVSGLETWDKKDEKAKKRWHGELIRNIELKKGIFSVNYSHTDDVLVTPVALINFRGGGGLFDVYDDILYSNASKSGGSTTGGVEYTNKRTKKSFLAKSDMPEEIVVTKDAIYRKGMLQMDTIFQNNLQLGLLFQSKAYKGLPSIDEKSLSEQYKNMPKNMEQVLGGFGMLKQMSPDDLARIMKMGEAHGAKVSPDVMEKFKEIPEALKAMEKEGTMDEMKKAMAMSKGLLEGLGDKGIERFARAQTEGLEKMKKSMGQPLQAVTAEGKTLDIESLLESPRKYKPLTDAKKVA